MAACTQADCVAVDIDPRRAGLGPVGHMGCFRPQAQPLWDAALHWFGRHPHAASV